MCTEATRVGQMIYVLRQLRQPVYEIKTDSVLYKPLKRRKKNQLAELSFADLSGLRDIYEGGRAHRLNDCHAVQPISESERKPFRVEQARVSDKLGGDPSGPFRTWALENIEKRVWRSFETEQAASQYVLDNGASLLVEGIAGTG